MWRKIEHMEEATPAQSVGTVCVSRSGLNPGFLPYEVATLFAVPVPPCLGREIMECIRFSQLHNYVLISLLHFLVHQEMRSVTQKALVLFRGCCKKSCTFSLYLLFLFGPVLQCLEITMVVYSLGLRSDSHFHAILSSKNSPAWLSFPYTCNYCRWQLKHHPLNNSQLHLGKTLPVWWLPWWPAAMPMRTGQERHLV